jgi:predicted PurR-regulated permease PerM
MTDRLSSPMLRLILGGAGLVVIMWGVMQAQHLILVLLISLFLAYVVAPLPRWLIRSYKLRTGMAILVTLVLVCITYAVITLLLVFTGVRIQQKLPFYQAHFSEIYQQLDAFASSHGIRLESLFPAKAPTSDRIVEFARGNLPTLAGLISDRVLIWLLSLLFLAEIAEQDESKRGVFAATLTHYGGEVQGFIAVMAKTGAINALANLVLYVAIGVDFPVLWAVLSFFMSFIPSVGFFIAFVPPVLVALIKFGWMRAALVAIGLIVINMIVEYVIQPMFMKKGLEISFLEVTLSLMFWSYLLGPWGAILAIPLTLSIKKFIAKPSKGEAVMEAMLDDDGLGARSPQGNYTE